MEISKIDVDKIIDRLIGYDGANNLSWTKVYKKVLNELEIEDSALLLSSVVRELTNLGYDIIGEPFKLEKYK